MHEHLTPASKTCQCTRTISGHLTQNFLALIHSCSPILRKLFYYCFLYSIQRFSFSFMLTSYSQQDHTSKSSWKNYNTSRIVHYFKEFITSLWLELIAHSCFILYFLFNSDNIWERYSIHTNATQLILFSCCENTSFSFQIFTDNSWIVSRNFINFIPKWIRCSDIQEMIS